MFKEELNLIKQAEQTAEAIRKESKQEAKVMIENANTNAQKLLDDAKVKAKEVTTRLIAEGEAEAQKEYDAAIEATRVKCADLEANAKTKELEVVSKIVERVKSSVNM